MCTCYWGPYISLIIFKRSKINFGKSSQPKYIISILFPGELIKTGHLNSWSFVAVGQTNWIFSFSPLLSSFVSNMYQTVSGQTVGGLWKCHLSIRLWKISKVQLTILLLPKKFLSQDSLKVYQDYLMKNQ